MLEQNKGCTMDLLEKVFNLEREADNFGFRWENTSQIMAQITSECAEIDEHLTSDPASLSRAHLQEEIGDLLHAAFSLCVFCQFDPTETLTKTLGKFERRLKAVKSLAAERGLSDLNGHSFEELMAIWAQAKSIVG
ncbi:MazG nucleotide pyrophosphohydrolase domain-containing protein [Legionella sp. CNM-4043-24]|uniref:MazG nucleotide pyrophosphohydrolase domain-containing protein n=1 Tax=Legionella sp. CNM-4043-24 TaxID=3421646 RepID=UPI00403B1B2E